MRSPFFPQTGAHDIHIWGIFCGNSRPRARRAVRFLDNLPAVRRHFSASAAPAPRCGYKIRLRVFYTASRLIRTLSYDVAVIVRQSADCPPSPTRPCPRSCPAKARQRLRRARMRRLYILFSYAGSPPNPRPSTRPAVCPALRVRISGNASAARTPCSRARCRDGSPCPADLVPFKMSAAPDGGTGVAEALRKTGLRRAPSASRKSGRYPASRATSGVAAMDSISVIHSTLRAKPVLSTQKRRPLMGSATDRQQPRESSSGP